MWFFNKNKKTVTLEEKAVDEQPKESLLKKLSEGLSKSSDKISEGITGIFTKKKLDRETLDQLEELLITADLGPETAARLVGAIGKDRFDKEITPEEIKSALADEVKTILISAEKPLYIEGVKPFVILVTGVNGAGKTTTIGKLAQQYKDQGKSVMLAAGDTFRAAAVQQLKAWGDRVGVPVVSKEEGADAAALAYEAVEKAQNENADILMIDTAGRLQNKAHLMEELSKVVRVIKKKMPDAPHASILVLDGTVGQNAHSQLEQFRQIIDVTGLVITKLDGTAKGGVIVSLVEKFRLPVHAIGIGEAVGDLRAFSAQDYAEALTGVAAEKGSK